MIISIKGSLLYAKKDQQKKRTRTVGVEQRKGKKNEREIGTIKVRRGGGKMSLEEVMRKGNVHKEGKDKQRQVRTKQNENKAKKEKKSLFNPHNFNLN